MARPLNATRYENEHKRYVSLMLTPSTIAAYDALAVQHGISRSEVIERVGRGLIVLPPSLINLAERAAS